MNLLTIWKQTQYEQTDELCVVSAARKMRLGFYGIAVIEPGKGRINKP